MIDFSMERGQHLAEVGMNLAVETANAEHNGWSDRCWSLFIEWLKVKPSGFLFMIENFRQYIYEYDLLERPRSERAFAFISKRAIKEGLVLYGGIQSVTNARAHSAKASIWIKV